MVYAVLPCLVNSVQFLHFSFGGYGGFFLEDPFGIGYNDDEEEAPPTFLKTEAPLYSKC